MVSFLPKTADTEANIIQIIYRIKTKYTGRKRTHGVPSVTNELSALISLKTLSTVIPI